MHLSYRPPADVSGVLDFLGAHAVPGLETYAGGVFTRVIGSALVSITPVDGAVDVSVEAGVADVDSVAAAARTLLDLATDGEVVDAALARDPALASLVAARPGLRAPGVTDAFETAVRTVVGQQISLRGARTVLGRIVATYGEPMFGSWFAFPTPQQLAGVDPADLPMPRARGRAVVALASAVVDGTLTLGGDDPLLEREHLLALPGIGPWTADYLLIRVARDRDVLLTSDLVVRRAAEALGISLADGRPDWAPWRTYATFHLWAHLYADTWRAEAAR